MAGLTNIAGLTKMAGLTNIAGLTNMARSAPLVQPLRDTRGMALIPREFMALRGGVLKRVYSVEQADGTVGLGDHEAWLASRAVRCSCGQVCRGSGRTCGQPECIARLPSA